MKILYIAVHSHKNWGAEYWLAKAFERHACEVLRFDYRQKRKRLMPWRLMKRQLDAVIKRERPDLVFVQRAEKMPAYVLDFGAVPVFFWSTEPLIRRRDVDALLDAGENFAHIFLHTYTCLSVVEREFPQIASRCSVLHNAAAVEVAESDSEQSRTIDVVFNRNVSARRQSWLDALAGMVKVVSGQYGEAYFATLKTAKIAVNIHYADSSVDDFETGIFEALACGSAVVTESLNPRTVADMGMSKALLEVADAKQMRQAVESLLANPEQIARLQEEGKRALASNTWDSRAVYLLDKFKACLGA